MLLSVKPKLVWKNLPFIKNELMLVMVMFFGIIYDEKIHLNLRKQPQCSVLFIFSHLKPRYIYLRPRYNVQCIKQGTVYNALNFISLGVQNVPYCLVFHHLKHCISQKSAMIEM